MNSKEAELKPDVKLQPHQQKLFDEVSNSKDGVRKLLMWQLGSGKSLGGLAGAEASKGPYTVIAPASLRETWRGEQAKFTDQANPSDIMSYTEVAKGKPVDKLETLISDEAHRLRNPGSQQTQNVQNLASKAKNVLLLSGSPLVNEPGDIAPLMSMLTRKEISPTEFNERYVQEKAVNPNLFQKLRGITAGTEYDVNHEDELKSLLKGHVDYYAPDKPIVPTNFEDHHVEMSKPQSEIYQMMFDKLPWIIRWKLQRNYPLSREEFMRMKAFMTGPRQVGLSTLPFLKNKDPDQAFRESSKLQKAFGLLQERFKDDRTKALVFSNFIDAGLTPYSAALRNSNIPHAVFHGGLNDVQRKRLVDDYNSNRIRVALLGPSGAEGLSFKGTQLVQLLDPYWHNVRTRQQQGRGIRFDSHTGLPDDLSNVQVQRFIARLPLGQKDRMLQAIGFDRSSKRVAADDILANLSARKDQLNNKFLSLLKEVGSEKSSGIVPPESLSLAIKQSEVDLTPTIPYTAGGIVGALAMWAAMKRMNRLPSVDPIAVQRGVPYMQPDPPEDKKKMWKDQAELMKVGLDTLQQPVGLIDRLKEIKRYSDESNWDAKHQRLIAVMQENPWQWDVNDDPNVGPRFVGVKHIPSNFKYHMPRSMVPPDIYAEVRKRKEQKPIIITDDPE